MNENALRINLYKAEIIGSDFFYLSSILKYNDLSLLQRRNIIALEFNTGSLRLLN